MPNLKVTSRKIFGRRVKSLREKGIVPATVYGHGLKPRSIEVPYLAFEKVFKEAGESSLIDLVIDQERPVKVLVYDLQLHPLTDRFQHIDFYQVKAGEKITLEIDLKFVGESRAVKESGGTLVPQLTKIKVECLPEDLIHELEVDVSLLNTFEDIIRIGDLKIPSQLKLLHHPEEVVVAVEPPISEAELKELEEKPEEKAAEVEVITEKKEEGEEGEGEKGKAEKKEKTP